MGKLIDRTELDKYLSYVSDETLRKLADYLPAEMRTEGNSFILDEVFRPILLELIQNEIIPLHTFFKVDEQTDKASLESLNALLDYSSPPSLSKILEIEKSNYVGNEDYFLDYARINETLSVPLINKYFTSKVAYRQIFNRIFRHGAIYFTGRDMSLESPYEFIHLLEDGEALGMFLSKEVPYIEGSKSIAPQDFGDNRFDKGWFFDGFYNYDDVSSIFSDNSLFVALSLDRALTIGGKKYLSTPEYLDYISEEVNEQARVRNVVEVGNQLNLLIEKNSGSWGVSHPSSLIPDSTLAMTRDDVLSIASVDVGHKTENSFSLLGSSKIIEKHKVEQKQGEDTFFGVCTSVTRKEITDSFKTDVSEDGTITIDLKEKSIAKGSVRATIDYKGGGYSFFDSTIRKGGDLVSVLKAEDSVLEDTLYSINTPYKTTRDTFSLAPNESWDGDRLLRINSDSIEWSFDLGETWEQAVAEGSLPLLDFEATDKPLKVCGNVVATKSNNYYICYKIGTDGSLTDIFPSPYFKIKKVKLGVYSSSSLNLTSIMYEADINYTSIRTTGGDDVYLPPFGVKWVDRNGGESAPYFMALHKEGSHPHEYMVVDQNKDHLLKPRAYWGFDKTEVVSPNFVFNKESGEVGFLDSSASYDKGYSYPVLLNETKVSKVLDGDSNLLLHYRDGRIKLTDLTDLWESNGNFTSISRYNSCPTLYLGEFTYPEPLFIRGYLSSEIIIASGSKVIRFNKVTKLFSDEYEGSSYLRGDVMTLSMESFENVDYFHSLVFNKDTRISYRVSVDKGVISDRAERNKVFDLISSESRVDYDLGKIFLKKSSGFIPSDFEVSFTCNSSIDYSLPKNFWRDTAEVNCFRLYDAEGSLFAEIDVPLIKYRMNENNLILNLFFRRND